MRGRAQEGVVKLYWFWSMNPQKVRFALEELGLAYERVTVDLLAREQRSPAFVAVNPMAKVPALEVDGEVLAESNAIVAWLGARERRLWPADPWGQAQALRWLFFEASELRDAGIVWFAEFVAPRVGRTPDAAEVEGAKRALVRPLGVLDAHLAARDCMLGEFSLVDCGVAPYVASLRPTSFDFAPYPNVVRWLDAIRARPAWQRCEFPY